MRINLGSYRALPLLSALVLMGCLVMALAMASQAEEGRRIPSEVRRPVDPTVLPPVPGPEEQLEEESVSVKPLSGSAPAPADAPVVIPHTPEKAAAPGAAEVTPMSETVTESQAPDGKKSQSAAGKGVVEKISLDSKPDRFTITVECNRPVGDVTYMNLDDPRRLVIDLHQAWIHRAAGIVRSAKGMVRHVVSGSHPDRFRLVVHFRKPPKGKLTPLIRRHGSSLTVTTP